MRTDTLDKKKYIIVLLLLMVIFTLTGCVSAKKKDFMFETLKEEGYIDVGDRAWDEYDEEQVVNQSPIPANAYYYIYKSGDTTYTIDYRAVLDDKEDTDTFKVRVETQKGENDPSTSSYIFENRKIFRLFWKMYFVGEE